MNHLLSISLALLPALAVYEFLPGTTLGMFIMLIVTFLFFFRRQNVIIAKDELYLMLSIFAISFVSMVYHSYISLNIWFDNILFIHNLYGIIICFIPIILAIRYADIKTLLYALYLLGSLASFVIIWQRFSLMFTGMFVQDVFLPGFEVARDIESMSINRPSAFFTEPAHFCIFMMPILYISLYSKRFIFSSLFLFAIFCSGSTTGLLLSALIIIYNSYNTVKRHRFSVMFLTVIVFSIVYYAIVTFYPQILLENMDKLSGVQEGNSDNRLLGPLKYLSFFDEFEIVFGITLNQLKQFLLSFGLYFGNNYANAMVYMLLSYGIIGFFIMVFYLYYKWKKSVQSSGLLLILIGVLCSDQILFNAHFLYLVSLSILAPRIYKQIIMLNENDKREIMLGYS